MVTSLAITAAGSGGTAGTYTLTFSGGSFAGNGVPTGTCTVAGGIITSLFLGFPGFGGTAAPTVTCPATGITGATVTATVTSSVATVPGDGDWVIGHPAALKTVTVDTNVGTKAGGGIKLIQIDNTALVMNTAAQRVITFASTGSDPQFVTAGNTQQQPNSTATMYGFIVGSDTGVKLDLEATSPTALTCSSVTAGNPTSFNCPSHGLASGAAVTILFDTTAGWTTINNHIFHVTVTDANNFTVAFNSTGFVGTFNGVVNVPNMALMTADEASPIYITHNPPWAGGFINNGTAIILKKVAVQSIGANDPDGRATGIYTTSQFLGNGQTETVDVENCLFLNYYQLAYSAFIANPDTGGPNYSFTWKNNVSTNAQLATVGQKFAAIFLQRAGIIAPPTITDNVDFAPIAKGRYLETFYLVPGLDIERNAVFGTSAIGRTLLGELTLLPLTASRTGQTIKDNLCANESTAVFNVTGNEDAFCLYAAQFDLNLTDVVDGLVSINTKGSLQLNTSGTTGSVFWLSNTYGTDAGDLIQGVVGGFNGAGSIQFSNSVLKAVSASGHNTQVFNYGATSALNALVLDGVVIDANGIGSAGVFMGESNFTTSRNAVRSSIATGAVAAGSLGVGISDCDATTVACNGQAYVQDTLASGATIGVHHNFTQNNAGGPYFYSTRSTGFQTGATAHPNAANYFDVTGGGTVGGTAYVDSTRTLTGFDSAIGGPGTTAHLTQILAQRNGWGGTCGAGCLAITDGGYGALNDNTIRAAVKYFLKGYVSQNPGTWQAGWQGGNVNSLPGTCTPGAANNWVYLTLVSAGQPGPYLCTATNTWTLQTPRDIGITQPVVQRIPPVVVMQ